ncbi:MAG: ATP-binding protein [Dehalococcoidia bacterium]|nr:ATP-binding protein [Dehalococcoidia bacterium]
MSEDGQRVGKRLGMIVGGSLMAGMDLRLDSGDSIEEMAVGRYVVIEGRKKKFFGMITDVTLGTIDRQIEITPPDMADSFVAAIIAGASTFGTVHVAPMLTIGLDAISLLEGPQPVKTVPSHFSEVREASEEDVFTVFGQDDESHFYVGTPLDMETKVCLDLKRFGERSSGIFGKSGTGKTFLTRILLIGLVQKGAAANLIFDMHNEYGWEGSCEGGQSSTVKGLKQLFPAKVAVFTLDEESSRTRKVLTDFTVEIGYDQVEPEDIEMLSELLGLSPRAMDAIYAMVRKYGASRWLETFLSIDSADDRDALAESLSLHTSTLRALNMSLSRLRRLKFLVPRSVEDSVQMILGYLDRGLNVVLEFGRYSDILAYVLVANILTRRIHGRYVEATERAMGDRKQMPRQLVITIEEAHKFLNPEVAKQTIFGTIAREMRKYNVTLLVVDQRPSEIDEEVMSQIGTRITCLLDNDKDIDAVLTGISGKNDLKTVLAKLETKQQALVVGHAVPMPVVIRTRDYGSAESYREFGFSSAVELRRRAEKDNDDLFGDR